MMFPYNRRCAMVGVGAMVLIIFTLTIVRLYPVDIRTVTDIPLNYIHDDADFETEQLYTNVKTGELYRSNKALDPVPMSFPDFGPDEKPNELWDKLEKEQDEFLDLENEKYAKPQDGHSMYYGDSNSLHNDKILILSASDGKGNPDIEDGMRLAMLNRQEYANMHGYTNYFVNISQFDLNNARPVWGKIPAILKAWDEHPQVEWIWWMDLDVIITNPYIDLHNYLFDPEVLSKKITWGRPLRYRRGAYGRGKYFANAEEADIDIERDINLIISQDGYGLNAGSFFIKKSPWTKKILLELWKNPYFMASDTSLHEQDILQSLILDHKSLTLRHVAFVPQRAINAYSDTSMWSWGRWKPNDFVVHFAGCRPRGGGGGDLCKAEWNKYYALRVRVPEEFRVPNDQDWNFEVY